MVSSSSSSSHSTFGISLLLLIIVLELLVSDAWSPTPTPWPYQFHATCISNLSGALQLDELWYDWPNGLNFNIERDQLAGEGDVLYNAEWTNGTSFFFYPLRGEDEEKECLIAHFEVGILRPNWMMGGNYLGQRQLNGFLCNVWEKADHFIWYYEDVVTKTPVHWRLFTGKETEILTFEVGVVAEQSLWQAPSYCFSHNTTIASHATVNNISKTKRRDSFLYKTDE